MVKLTDLKELRSRHVNAKNADLHLILGEVGA